MKGMLTLPSRFSATRCLTAGSQGTYAIGGSDASGFGQERRAWWFWVAYFVNCAFCAVQIKNQKKEDSNVDHRCDS